MDEKRSLKDISLVLNELNFDYETLSESQKKHLINIDAEIFTRFISQKESINSLKHNKINITTISDSICITRKTIYNNLVLKDYIEYYRKIYESNLPMSGLTEFKEELNESKEIIQKMTIRDIETSYLKNELNELLKEIEYQSSKINDLTSENDELTLELNTLKSRKIKKNEFSIIK